MGLMNKIFGGRTQARSPGASTQFAESQNATSLDKTKSRNAPRRELVKLVLRETMRKHGIPSDWIDCRALSVLTRQHKSGMHVQFMVRKADQQLLPYVHAFQESFWEQILRMDPHARDWLFSVGWEFYGKAQQGFSGMPDPTSWDTGGDTQTMEGDTLPPERDGDEEQPAGEAVDDDVASDLEALQQLMSAPAELAELPKAKPRAHKTQG